MTQVQPYVQQIPLQSLPPDIASRVADLAFAGRYIPAGVGSEPVAGDFYDVLRLTSDLIAIIVGDVAGHGETAVVRMQQLRAAVRAYAVDEPGPARVLTRLDRFCALLDAESIATLWYGEYCPSTGVLTYGAAGHLPPVLTCHGDPTQLLELDPGPPLGVGAEDALVQEHTKVLPPGAVLVAYSDGLVERHRASIDDQLERLQTTVTLAADPSRPASAQQIAEEILEALVPKPAQAADDVCVLVVRREGPA